MIAVAFLGARSSFQHRGVNPAMVAFSSDGLVNSLVLNSGYSVLYAAQQFKDEGHLLKPMAKWILMKCCVLSKQAVGALKVIIFQRRFQP